MAKVLLISEQHIKNNSTIEDNVDGKILQKVIHNFQEVHVKGVLGTTLYNSVLSAVESGTVSGTTKTLIEDYIQPFMINGVVAEFIIVNNFKLTNKGTLKLTDNVGNAVTPQELEYFKDHYDANTSQFKANLVKYLKDNNLVESCSDNINTTSNSIGWYLIK